jgi:hypothetical protein
LLKGIKKKYILLDKPEAEDVSSPEKPGKSLRDPG